MSNEDKENIDGAQIAGDIWGNVSNASTIYGFKRGGR